MSIPSSLLIVAHISLEDPSQDYINQDSCRNAHACDFEDGDRVALFCHHRQSSGAAFQVRRERGENFALVTGEMLASIW